ncbi:MAG: OB-fold nucleic acid binding domain-containing protein [Halobacteriales archaeon]
MGTIEDLHADLEAEVSLDAFRERVAEKVEEMGGLTDEETAAILVAHEIEGDRPIDVEQIDPAMDVATVLGVVRHVGEVRTFERDDGVEGAVVNVEVADGTGTIRAAFWDEMAAAATEELDAGDVLRLKGRPRDGFAGLELSVTDVRIEEDLELEVGEPEATPVAELEPGQSGVTVVGEVLRVETPRTFDRDDGSTGRVATVVLGDGTGAVGVSLWDDATAATAAVTVGEAALAVGAEVRERDGRPEVHVGGRARLEPVDEAVRYEPQPTPIEALTEGDVATVSGVVRATDPVNTFDRRDGTEGRVRNVRVQDATGSIRVALWGERADVDLGPGDEVTVVDGTVQDGYRDDVELSANWRSTVLSRAVEVEASEPEADEPAPTGPVEFTGTVVQPGDPIILDDGAETVHVEYGGDVGLGERVTVRGERDGDRIRATDLEPARKKG